MNYQPNPICTHGVVLTHELAQTLEAIAMNTHDVWAKGRMDEGWVYGDTHDVEKKTHPSLVSYHELPESEKDYDRRTSLQVIKYLLKMGYTIIPPK
jgi:hypothetical protein